MNDQTRERKYWKREYERANWKKFVEFWTRVRAIYKKKKSNTLKKTKFVHAYLSSEFEPVTFCEIAPRILWKRNCVISLIWSISLSNDLRSGFFELWGSEILWAAHFKDALNLYKEKYKYERAERLRAFYVNLCAKERECENQLWTIC